MSLGTPFVSRGCAHVPPLSLRGLNHEPVWLLVCKIHEVL